MNNLRYTLYRLALFAYSSVICFALLILLWWINGLRAGYTVWVAMLATFVLAAWLFSGWYLFIHRDGHDNDLIRRSVKATLEMLLGPVANPSTALRSAQDEEVEVMDVSE